jgi:hypothetical protein
MAEREKLMKEKLTELQAWVHGLKNAPTWKQRFWHIGEILRIFFTRTLRISDVGQTIAIVPIVVMLVFVAGGVYLVVRNQAHANTKHGEAAIAARAAVMINIQDKEPGCDMYVQMKRGTILALTHLGTLNPEGYPLCAACIWRVLEDNGNRFLYEEGYECTTYPATCSYWNKVIKDDHYVPLGTYPDLQNTFLEWLRIQSMPQYP